MTANDLWLPTNLKFNFHYIWGTHMPIMRFMEIFLLDISCLQVFSLMSSSDPKWPPPNNRGYLLNMGHPHAKYEISGSFSPWDIVFTSFTLSTSGDPKWPLIPPKLEKSFFQYSVLTSHVWYSLKFPFLRYRVYIGIFRGFCSLTSGDPRWPLISTKK